MIADGRDASQHLPYTSAARWWLPTNRTWARHVRARVERVDPTGRRVLPALALLHTLRHELADDATDEVRRSDRQLASHVGVGRNRLAALMQLLEEAGQVERIGRFANNETHRDPGWRLLQQDALRGTLDPPKRGKRWPTPRNGYAKTSRHAAAEARARLRETGDRAWLAAWGLFVTLWVEDLTTQSGALHKPNAAAARSIGAHRVALARHLELLERVGLVERLGSFANEHGPTGSGWSVADHEWLQEYRPEPVDNRRVGAPVVAPNIDNQTEVPVDERSHHPRVHRRNARGDGVEEKRTTSHRARGRARPDARADGRPGSNRQVKPTRYPRAAALLSELPTRLAPADRARLERDRGSFRSWVRLMRDLEVVLDAKGDRHGRELLLSELTEGNYTSATGNAWAAMWHGRVLPLALRYAGQLHQPPLAVPVADPDDRDDDHQEHDRPRLDVLEVVSGVADKLRHRPPAERRAEELARMRAELDVLPGHHLQQLASRADLRAGHSLRAMTAELRIRTLHAELEREREGSLEEPQEVPA